MVIQFGVSFLYPIMKREFTVPGLECLSKVNFLKKVDPMRKMQPRREFSFEILDEKKLSFLVTR